MTTEDKRPEDTAPVVVVLSMDERTYTRLAEELDRLTLVEGLPIRVEVRRG